MSTSEDGAMHAPFLQNLQRLRRLQSLEQWAELRCGRMQRSVAIFFFVGGYISHSSMLNTSQAMGTFINCLNPERLERTPSNLQSFNNIVCLIYCFLFFLFLVKKVGSILSAKTTNITSSPHGLSSDALLSLRTTYETAISAARSLLWLVGIWV